MTGMTPEQELASDPSRSVWVGANAGTGKTHVLTARVLRMMVTGTRPDKILCLTFTKAAANEMANRIYRELGAWTRLDDAALTATLYERVNERADDAMLTRARTLFAEVLDIPGGLKIMTIHAFCNSLLGRFPLESHLPPNFELMDDRSQQEKLDDATDATYAHLQAGLDEETKAALFYVARRASEFTFTDLMAAVNRERGGLRKRIKRLGSEAALVQTLADVLSIDPDFTAADIDHMLMDPKWDDQRRYLLVQFKKGKAKLQARVPILEAVLASSNMAERLTHVADYRAVFLSAKDEPLTIRGLGLGAVIKEEPALEGAFLDEQARVLTLHHMVQKLVIFKQTTALLRLSLAIMERYEVVKNSHGKVDFDDLILRTDQLLNRADIAPWILFKLDGGLDHIMVDEAQDTNPEQWRLIDQLSTEFFVGDSAQEVNRTVFTVGDAKQSIYGFQRAEPQEFVDSRDRLRDRAEGADKAFSAIQLDMSFRSTDAVLGLVDKVFDAPEIRRNLTFSDADPIHHTVHRKYDAGLVELWPMEEHIAEAMPDTWEPPITQIATDSADSRLAARIAIRIEDMLKTGEMLESKGRPIRAGDILILVRRRVAFSEHLLRELKARHIPVAGSDRLNVTEHIGVMDLMALAHMTLNPLDDLTLATILKSPFIGMDEDQLMALAMDRGSKGLWQALAQRVRDTAGTDRAENNGNGGKSGDAGDAANAIYRDALTFISDAISYADYMTPFEFFSTILIDMGGRRKLVGRLGVDVHDPLNEFLNLAMDYEHNHTPAMQGFLHWLAAGSAEIKRDMDTPRNEVRIMTIHGAKGLQAPIVFLPDTCSTPQTPRDIFPLNNMPGLEGAFLWITGDTGQSDVATGLKAAATDRQMSEYLRLLYVALTRAEDRLYIGGWAGSKGRSKGCWYDLIEAAFKALPEAQEIREETTTAADEMLEEAPATYRWQTAQRRDPDKKAESPMRPRGSIVLPTWALTNPPLEGALAKPLSPSKMDEEAVAVISPLLMDEGGRSRYLRGTLIHKLLEILPETAEEKRQAVSKNYLSDPAFGLSVAEVDDIWQKIDQLLTDAQFAPLFGPDSQAEVSFSAIVAGQPVAGQIDRLLVTEGEVLVIDYKTNRPPAQTLDAVPPQYVRQMAVYRDAMQQIYPNKTIRTALLWTEELRLMTLPDDLLSERLFAAH